MLLVLRIAPGIEEHETEHGPVLGVFGKPNRDHLFKEFEAFSISSHEAVHGHGDGIGILVPPLVASRLETLLVRQVVA